MALQLPRGASDDQILKVVDEWVQLLAEAKYEDALSLVAARPRWTPELLEKVIEGYGLAEPHRSAKLFRVTSPQTARQLASGPRSRTRRVERWETPNSDGVLGMVEIDLPLDGYWSDLTALFDLRLTGAGLVLALDDVHVL